MQSDSKYASMVSHPPYEVVEEEDGRIAIVGAFKWPEGSWARGHVCFMHINPLTNDREAARLSAEKIIACLNAQKG